MHLITFPCAQTVAKGGASKGGAAKGGAAKGGATKGKAAPVDPKVSTRRVGVCFYDIAETGLAVATPS